MNNSKSDKDLQSTVNDVGKHVTQIIHFIDGQKRTFTGIKSDSIIFRRLNYETNKYI